MKQQILPTERAARRGAVLMETLLVLPLYMVLFGGILWIGDLILAKQQLVIADRFAAANLGNRHAAARGVERDVERDVNNLFFSRGVHPNQKARVRPNRVRSDNRWWDLPGATVTLTVTMPDWIKGWFAATGKVWFDDREPDRLQVMGRDVKQLDHYAVVMRSSKGGSQDYPRCWTARELADRTDPWKKLVYKEPWPMHLGTVPVRKRPEGEDYTRFTWYVKWSS